MKPGAADYTKQRATMSNSRNEPHHPAAAGEADHLILSQEQLNYGVERVVSGYARLEKYLVTETKTIQVEVTHEEVRLVHEPPADVAGNQRGADFSSVMNDGSPDTESRWMYLSREEIVVSKRVVPVERVRLQVHSVTEQQQITEDVRSEKLETDTPTVDPI